MLLELLIILSIWGFTFIKEAPARHTRNQEISQLKEEILSFETYADLTPFGLGLYKLGQEGDKYLWDITKPENHVIAFDGVSMVYETHFNRRNEESWDNAWDYSNMGKDVMYDIIFYDGIYIIITPIRENPDATSYWGYVYLCKKIDKNVDLFDIDRLDLKVVEKLRELPGEKISRKELSEKLGKTF